jgi:8-oxo-dGTP pyrophosphatase MutT (NUDIX family)
MVKVNITKAGTIPYYYDSDKTLQMLFMLPSSPKRKGYQVAKGSIEKNESVLKAALRESSEELGLKNDNIQSIIRPGIVYNNMIIFGIRVIDPLKFDTPSDNETMSVKWMTLEQFHEVGTPMHLPVVYGLLNMLRD